MTRRTRTILFLVFLFLFLLIAPAAVFYSQGYRIDLNPPAGGKMITQTGGLFLKIEPKQVEIYLDDKLVKKTDFFFGSALIENLLPKKYKVQVKKEGYRSWEKILEVKEKGVTEVKSIILVPEKNNFTVLNKNTENFWPSPDGKKIVLKEGNPPAGGGWALKLYDLDRNLKSHLIEEKNISSGGADLLNLEWSEDSKEIYLKIGMKEQEKNFVLNLGREPVTLTERKIPPLPEDVIVSEKFAGDIYYLDNLGYFFRTDPAFSTKIKISQAPFPIQQETEYKLRIFPDYFFLEEGKISYLFNKDSGSFEKFFEEIKDLKISPDKKKLVFFSNSEIWVLFLKDIFSQQAKKSGEKLFLLRLSEKIGDAFWLNDNYLIFNSGNNIKIAEIDGRDRIQTWDIGEFQNPTIFFNAIDKKLYILSEKNLFASENLLK